MKRLSERMRTRLSAARREDLRALHEFCAKIVPDGFAGLELWLARHDKNPNIFQMVEAQDGAAHARAWRLVGSFALTPVTEAARLLLEQEKLKGVDFTPEHIASPGERPAAIYISGIVALEHTAKGVTLRLIDKALRREAERGTRLLYTRPMSDDGLRVVEKNGFSPIDPAALHCLDRIYKKEVS